MAESRPPSGLVRLFELLELLALRRLGHDGLPPSLTAAAIRGDIESLEIFLAQGARLDEETIGYGSPLAGAVRSGRVEVIERLLRAGAKADSADAANAAAQAGRIDLLDVLFAAGLNPASASARGALVTAAIAGKASVMRSLVARGVAPNPFDVTFAAWQAESNGFDVIAAYLRGTRGDLDGVADGEMPRPGIEFRRDPREEDTWPDDRLEAEALELVDEGTIEASSSETNQQGQSLLGAAIDARSVDLAVALLDRGANPHWGGSVRIGDGQEPLWAPVVAAAERGLVSVIDRIARDATPDDRDLALVRAARHGLPESVASLVAAGANPAFVTEGGDSALSIARGPHRDAIRALLRKAMRRHGIEPGPALANFGAKPRKRTASLRGVSELVRSQLESQPDWCVLALRRSIGEAAAALSAHFGAARVESDVGSRGVWEATQGAFVLQLAGHLWTVELHALGFHRRGRLELDERRAARLSVDLACEAILCAGSDASGSFDAVRFEGGAPVDRGAWDLAADLKAADAWFASRELFLPGCRIDNAGAGPRLELARIAASAVARLDYLVFEE